MVDKYLFNNGGVSTEKAALQASTGATDAGKLVALDSTGLLDASLLPVGIGADTASVVSSESLAAGDLVNIWNNAGTANVRKADGSTAGKEAQGFVLASVTSPALATVYFTGSNTQMTGLTPGRQFLSVTTPGKTQAAAPTAAGQVSQIVGFATSATEMNYQPRDLIVLA